MNECREAPAAAMPPGASVTPQFLGRRGDLFKLVAKTLMFTLLTLGVYRFWAKTRLRRFFWGNVIIDGEPLEYTGKATELLVGFLIVVAVLVPLSVISTIVGFLAEDGPAWVGISFNVAYVFVFVFLIDFATYRMWRYRLTRTRWRGIRFGMENGALRYAGLASLWRMGQVLSLGFITPWARLDLAKFRIDRMRLGDVPFAMDPPVGPLVLRWMAVWGIPFAVVFGLLAFGYGKSMEMLFRGIVEEGGSSGAFFAALAVALAAGTVLFVFYRIFETGHFIRCTTIGGTCLGSGLRARAIVPAYVLAWAIILALFAAIVGLSVTGFLSPPGEVMGLVASIAVFGLLLVLSPLVIYPIAVFQTVRHVWTTLSIHDIGALDGVVQAPGEAPRFGEGLADALDVGAI